MPLLTRRNYRLELGATTFLALALGMVEGGTLGVVVKIAFGDVASDRALNFAVGVIIAAPEFANLSSFLWAAVSHGRSKVRLVAMLQAAVLALLGLVALVPRTGSGLVVMVGVVVLTRILVSGVMTLRSTIWSANYPRDVRARLTGKLAVLQSTVIAAVGVAIGVSMDAWPDSFRVLFPAAAAAGVIGLALYQQIRMRHAKLLIRAERAERAGDRRGGPTLSPMSVWRTLRDDRAYARFMLCMFILGTGNLMLTAPLVITLREQFHLGYLRGIVVIQSIPYIVAPLVIPLWARLLDRVHVVRFRAIHSWAFVTSQGLVFLAAVLHLLPLMYGAMVFQGIGLAGGRRAGTLGHLDFAPPHKAAQYMGVHVTLNGVRGLLAPLGAVGVYQQLDRTGAGAWVFGISVLLCTAGALGFVAMSRRMNDEHPSGRRPRLGGMR